MVHFYVYANRSVHLEVTSDLTVSSYLNVFRRFIARRGPIQYLFSDSETNFVGSKKVLQQSIEA